MKNPIFKLGLFFKVFQPKFTIILFTLTIFTPIQVKPQIANEIANLDVKDWIEDAENSLRGLGIELMSRFDIITNQKFELLNVMLENLKIDLRNDLDKKIAQVDVKLQNLINNFNDQISGGISSIERLPMELDLIMDVNLSNTCKKLSSFLCKNTDYDYPIKYFENFTQEYSEFKTVYRVNIGGARINMNTSAYILIDGKHRVNGDDRNGVAYKKGFDIKAGILNQYFKNRQFNSLPIEIILINESNRKRTWMEYFLGQKVNKLDTLTIDTRIFLLPKYPFEYAIVETFEDTKWSKENYRRVRDDFQCNPGRLDERFVIPVDKNKKVVKLENYWADPATEEKDFLFNTPIDVYVFGCKKDFEYSRDSTEVTLICRDIGIKKKYLYQPFTLLPNSSYNRLFGMENGKFVVKNDFFSFPTIVPTWMAPDIQIRRVSIEYLYKVKEPLTRTRDLLFNVEEGKSLKDEKLLKYGTHFSENFNSEESTYVVKLMPTFLEYSGPEDLSIKLTESKRVIKFEGLANLDLRIDRHGGSNRIRLEIEKLY